MSKWQDKSNEEINIAVTGHRFNCSNWALNNDKSAFFSCKVGDFDSSKIDVLDFCKEWGFAGPLIQESIISIEPNYSYDFEGGSKRTKFNGEWGAINDSYCDYIKDENPLRAAMIVYLEINGVQPNE